MDPRNSLKLSSMTISVIALMALMSQVPVFSFVSFLIYFTLLLHFLFSSKNYFLFKVYNHLGANAIAYNFSIHEEKNKRTFLLPIFHDAGIPNFMDVGLSFSLVVISFVVWLSLHMKPGLHFLLSYQSILFKSFYNFWVNR